MAGGVLVALLGSGCGGPDPNVATYHNDNFRTGAYLAETVLTPQAVRNRGMHIKYWVPPCAGPIRDPRPPHAVGCLDGTIATQPLYLHRVDFSLDTPIGNLRVEAPAVFVATTSNKVYALDAEHGWPLWVADLMIGANGQEVNPGYHSRWINSTPVIDVGRRRIYVVFSTKNRWDDLPFCNERDSENPATRVAARQRADALDVQQWIATIDITTGRVINNRRIEAQMTARNGRLVKFVGKHQQNHPALLLHDGSLFVAFGSPAWSEGCVEYHGWVFRYDASTLARQDVFNTSIDWPGPSKGAGVWQGGGGLAADASGIYFLTGDGRSDTSLELEGADFFRHRRFYGDHFLKLRPTSLVAPVQGFSPSDAPMLEAKDADLGSGGALIIPNSDVVVGGGKSGYLYAMNRSSMTLRQQFIGTTNKYNPSKRGDTWNEGPHLHGSPAYWAPSNQPSGLFFVWGEKDVLRQYRFDKSSQRFDETPKEATVVATPTTMPGGMLSLSADGSRPGSAIVWATLPMSNIPDPHPGGLYAYNAETLDFLWHARYGTISHWVPPTIADGKVFLAEGSPFMQGSERLTVYELGDPNGRERWTGGIPQPARPPVCQSCHSRDLDRIANGLAMHVDHQTGGEARMKPGAALAALTPPAGFDVTAILQGTGARVYEARLDPIDRRTLVWILKDAYADLTMQPPSGTNDATAVRSPAVRVKMTNGSLWTASDGSTVTTDVAKAAAAPSHIDTEWTLLRATKNGGEGLLGRVSFIQQVYTHAGRPPSTPPKKSGETATVPFMGEFWLYR